MGSSDGELVCYDAGMRFGILCTNNDHPGIRSMGQKYLLLCEPRYSKLRFLIFICICSSSSDSERRPPTNLQAATTIVRTVTYGPIRHAFGTGDRLF